MELELEAVHALQEQGVPFCHAHIEEESSDIEADRNGQVRLTRSV